MNSNKVRMFPASRLAEDKLDAFFCIECKQTGPVKVITVLKFISSDEGISPDQHYLNLYLDLVSDKFSAICLQRFYTPYPSKLSKRFIEERNEVIHYHTFTGEDEVKYAELIFRDAVFSCPNCGGEMIYKEAVRAACSEGAICRNEWGACAPGCYICMTELIDECRDEGVAFCAACYARNDGDVDCSGCIYDYGRRQLDITLEEIAECASNNEP